MKKLPKKQWKTPAEEELFDHLPARLGYNVEGLSEREQQENFKVRYYQALLQYRESHPLEDVEGTTAYVTMHLEGLRKEIGEAMTAVVEPYVEGKKPVCAFPEYEMTYATWTDEHEVGGDTYTSKERFTFSAKDIPMGEKAQQAAQKIKRSYEQTRYKGDDWGYKRFCSVVGVILCLVLSALLVPPAWLVVTGRINEIWLLAILPDVIKVIGVVPLTVIFPLGALVSVVALLYNLKQLLFRLFTSPVALQAEFCRTFEENALAYYRWLAFFHYWQYKKPRAGRGLSQDFDKWEAYYEELHEGEEKAENEAAIQRHLKKGDWPTQGLEGFVTRCYRVAFGRDPDEDGFQFYVIRLQEGYDDAKGCAVDFMLEDEMQPKVRKDEAYVRMLYRLFLDREGTPAEVQSQVRELAQGRTRDELLARFSESPEFASLAARYGIH